MTAGEGTAAKAVVLPPVSVAKFKEGLALLEQMVTENRRAFIEHGQEYREAHRDATLRPLNAEEAASLAAGFPNDPRSPEELAAAFHDGDLRAYDEPMPLEVLAHAGAQLAPALMLAGQRLTVLMEMNDEEFEEARESGNLLYALDERVVELDKGGLRQARERAQAALEHLTGEMGVEQGKVLGLLMGSVWRAFSEAIQTLIPRDQWTSSSSTASLASTDGTGERSSTEPATATPVA